MRAKIFFGVVFAAASAALAFACSSSSSGPSDTSGDGGGGDSSTFVLGKANGTVGAFSTGPTMPSPRANHCAVATDGYLIVIGGNYKDTTSGNFVSLSSVDAAKINAADGSIGDWKTIGQTPSPVSSCTAAAHGNTIYLLDGIYDDESAGGKVYSASIGADGTLAQFQSIGAMPENSDVYASTAWIDGPDGGETLSVFNSVLSVALEDDAGFLITDDAGNETIIDAGALTILQSPLSGIAWTEAPFLNAFRGSPELAYSSGFVYAMGGYPGSADGGPPDFPMEVNGAARQSTSLGASFSTTALPMATMFGQAVAVDGFVFVVGGRDDIFSGTPRADVISAPIDADGSIGGWATQTSMPEPRTNGRVVSYGNFMYVTGGGNDGPGLDSVFIARVRF
ncbi:MAG: hypothetical protein ACRELY_19035 [Polyangiaceae bacterium]